jgi:hypothetical protein
MQPLDRPDPWFLLISSKDVQLFAPDHDRGFAFFAPGQGRPFHIYHPWRRPMPIAAIKGDMRAGAFDEVVKAETALRDLAMSGQAVYDEAGQKGWNCFMAATRLMEAATGAKLDAVDTKAGIDAFVGSVREQLRARAIPFEDCKDSASVHEALNQCGSVRPEQSKGIAASLGSDSKEPPPDSEDESFDRAVSAARIVAPQDAIAAARFLWCALDGHAVRADEIRRVESALEAVRNGPAKTPVVKQAWIEALNQRYEATRAEGILRERAAQA